jgi:phosphatidylserine/phosphatidylglycerophosphate/cardiolipin synthase-like enzyme
MLAPGGNDVVISLLSSLSLALLLATPALAAGPPPHGSPTTPPDGSGVARSEDTGSEIAGFPFLEIVESVPAETPLDHPGIRNTSEVWLEMIRSAQQSLRFAMFYASNREGSALDRVVRAIEEAVERRVKVQFLTEESFYRTYPETLDRLARAGVEVRRLNTKETMGGVMHAKYFIVDGAEVFIGSQNFDWRSLEHIQEIGLRVVHPATVANLCRIFARDFEAAGGEASCEEPAAVPERKVSDGDTVSWRLVASPTGYLPEGIAWDETTLVNLLDGARERIEVQLLTYNPVTREGEYFAALENALRRAAARGVEVHLLLSDWCKRPYVIPYLKSLTLVPRIEVRLVTIPEHSSGFIPYARVIHAKYAVVDGKRAWVGTGNWEKGYFHDSRNVGIVVESPRIGGILHDFFESGWEGTYAEPVRPEVEYEPPRIRS